MSTDFDHIDQLYRDRLKGFKTPAKKKRIWFLLSIKLLLLNLTASGMFIAGTVLIVAGGATATLLYIHTSDSAEAMKGPVQTENTTQQAEDKMFRLETKSSSHLPIDKNEDKIALKEPDNSLIAEFSEAHGAGKGASVSAEAPMSTVEYPVFSQRQSLKSDALIQTGSSAFRAPIAGTGQLEVNNGKTDRVAAKLFNDPLLDSLVQLTLPQRRVALEAFVDPGFAFTGNRTTWGNQPNNTLRVDHHDLVFSPGAGIDLKYQWGEWFLSTGIHYRQWIESGNYKLDQQTFEPNLSVESVDTVVRLYYDPPVIGEPIIVRIDTFFISGYATSNRNGQWQLKTHLVEFPFMIGYSHTMNKVRFEVSTGLSAGLEIRQTGGIPAMATDSEFKFEQPEVQSTTWSFLLNAGITIPYRERLRILFKPEIRYNLQDLYLKDNFDLNGKRMRYGIRLGLVYEL